ncbi:MAG: hypothetical protein ABIP94_01485 [Planctomycetota bacterium]
MRPFFLASLFVVFCGAFAGNQVAALVPPPPRADEDGLFVGDYRFERRADRTFDISDGHWLPVPRQFADFDLQMDVELSESMDLDVLLRQVEPRPVQGKRLPFHARFAVLRLSTGKGGPGWLSRDDALLGPPDGGVELAPGHLATVWVQGRGRQLRANVAGKWLPWFQADDEYGMFTLVARGGKAVMHRFVIENRGQPRAWLWSRWFWVLLGAVGGGLVVAAGAASRAGWFRMVVLGVWLAGSVWLLRGEPVFAQALLFPPPSALLGLLGGASVFAAVLLLASRWRNGWLAALCIALVGGAWGLVVQDARKDLRFDDPGLDSVFGPRAGNTVSEAHAQLVRGPFEVHDPTSNEPRVFLLGGQLLYGRNLAPEVHVEPLLRGELRAALQKPIAVPCLPTADGHAQQQWRMFTAFYTRYRPKVIVLGVPRDEAAIDEATGLPRSNAGVLEATLKAARAHCAANGCSLVLFTEVGLPGELLAVLQAASHDGVPVVVADEADEPAALAKKLAAAILPLLR